MAHQQLPDVPMLDLSAEAEALWPELSAAVNRVLRSGRYVLGPEVEAFESEVAAYLGVSYAIGLNSGTDALVIGLRALGVGPGDEVITTDFSFFATAEAIIQVGATPVFVDVREDSFNLDPQMLEAAVTERSKAILPVHLFGNPAAMGKIVAVARKHGLKVLEDCAQSFGAVYGGETEGETAGDTTGGAEGESVPEPQLSGRKTGALGDAAAFSFYPTKNLGAYGDGGMLVTDDEEIAGLARMLRNHGAPPERRYEHRLVGYNSRLDEIQAAILRVKLPRVEGWNAARRDAAGHYRELLAGVPGLVPPTATRGHVYHQFTVRLPAECREELRLALEASGVASAVFYPSPLHRAAGGLCGGDWPVSERLAGEVLSLPIWPEMSRATRETVAEALRRPLPG